MRTAFIKTLCELAEQDERVWLLTGDLGYSVLECFRDQFPDRFVNVGVAEQNMIGVAAGLAMQGNIVFTYSISNFGFMRCLEQIRNDVCYHNANVKIVSIGCGFTYGPHGYTHHGLEDLAIMRTLPRMTVIAPADPLETKLAVQAIASYDGPCYLRLGKTGESVARGPLKRLEIGKGIKIREGEDAALLSCGNLLKIAVQAANEAKTRKGIAAYSMPFVKPIDKELIVDLALRYPIICTLEEGQLSGGFGSAVSEIISELPAPKARLYRLGIPDTILERAYTQKSALALFKLTVPGIVEFIENIL